MARLVFEVGEAMIRTQAALLVTSSGVVCRIIQPIPTEKVGRPCEIVPTPLSRGLQPARSFVPRGASHQVRGIARAEARGSVVVRRVARPVFEVGEAKIRARERLSTRRGSHLSRRCTAPYGQPPTVMAAGSLWVPPAELVTTTV